jgi:hypothetical protein
MRFNGYQYIRLSGGGNQDMTLRGIRSSGYQEMNIRLSEYQAIQKSLLMPWYPGALLPDSLIP